MQVHPLTSEAYQLFHKGALALSNASQQGIRLDLPYTENMITHLERRKVFIEDKFKDTKLYEEWDRSVKGKVNIHSVTQLSHFLYQVKKLEVPKYTDKGGAAVDEEALSLLGLNEIAQLINARKLKKIQDVLKGFMREQVNGYIHPVFNLHLVKTYRSSSDSPNFQNIPKRDKEAMTITRRALFPRPGNQLFEIDNSNLEVRISACYHKDRKMLQYINDPSTDMHTDMAKEIFIIDNFHPEMEFMQTLRQATKNGFVFPQFYGDYYKTCAYNLACNWGGLPKGKWKPGQGISLANNELLPNLSDHLISKGFRSLYSFENHIQKIEYSFWNERFREYNQWKFNWWEKYQNRGYFDFKTGFRCSGVMSKKHVCNYPIQGAAFHCLLWALIKLDKIMITERWKSRIIGQIHDSILLDIYPPELERVTQRIHNIIVEDLPEAWKWIIIPLKIDAELCPIDGSWAEKEKIEIN